MPDTIPPVGGPIPTAPPLPPGGRYELRGEIARGVDLLRRAVRKGYANPARIPKDPDLAPLRDRPDFRRLLDELGAKPPPREPAPPPRQVG